MSDSEENESRRTSLEEMADQAVAWRKGAVENPLEWWTEGDRLMFTARRLAEPWPHLLHAVTERPADMEAIQELLLERETVVPSYLLLTGFAFENYLKAIRVAQLVGQGKSMLNDEGRLLHLKTHDLVKLAKDASVFEEFDSTQRIVLQMLAWAAEWDGRYKFAWHEDSQRTVSDVGDRLTAPSRMTAGFEDRHIEPMIPKLKAKLLELLVP